MRSHLIAGFRLMSDTVKIKRPLFCRRHEDLGGRVKEDLPGNTIKVRTRARESEDDLPSSILELTDKSDRPSEG
jgi:hypothetical protein